MNKTEAKRNANFRKVEPQKSCASCCYFHYDKLGVSCLGNPDVFSFSVGDPEKHVCDYWLRR